MLGCPNLRIRRLIGLWLNINSLSTVHLKDKEAHTKGKMSKGNMDKCAQYSSQSYVSLNQNLRGFKSIIQSPYFYESFYY